MTVDDWNNSDCGNCGFPISAYEDLDGIWAECACDAGYVE